jgi:TolB-like protein/Tfp pilus assembly protein PilF
MTAQNQSELKFEIGHVLFIDIVRYSALLINQQSEQLETLRQIVRGTEQVRTAEAEDKLLRLPTGDGGGLVFRNSPEAPVLCALEIARALKSHPEVDVRMGIHSGPVNEITDLNEQANIAGAGINIAQRVMDCGDAGHILLSRHVAEDLEHYPRWQPYLHPLGDCEVKHGQVVSAVNLYNNDIGNPAVPAKFGKSAIAKAMPTTVGGRPRYMIAALAVGAIIVLAGSAFLLKVRQNETGAGASLALIPEKSIAVLPFQNLSDDKSNTYFADGVQDEILTRLSKIAALKVISRTSTQKYKSTPDNLRDVGRQLGVAHILEGSVQKIANAVHVNVQLIRAATDEHLWAESYNRKLDDVFGVEGEVASTIAEQLNTKLSGTEQKAMTDKPTQNTAAYDAYLRGLSIEHNQYGYEAYQQAAREYLEAVQLDPNFAFAWGRLAVIRSFLFFNAVDRNTNTAGAVKKAADRAIELAPEAGESWIAQGAYRYRVLRDFEGAVAAYKQAQTRLPNNSYVLQNLAFVLRRVGRWNEAEANFKKALELDPRDVTLLNIIGGEFFNLLRRFDDARAALDRALEISPDSMSAHASKAGVFQMEGRMDEAAQELARFPAESTDDWVLNARINLAIYERHFDRAISVIERKLGSLPAGQPLDSITELALVQLGLCQQWTGRDEDARRSFSRAIEAIKPNPDAPVPPDSNGTPNTLALAYAGLGEKAKAIEQAQRSVKGYDTDGVNKPWALVTLAQIQARFGDHDAAIAALPHLLEVPAGLTIASLKLDPLWDPLREDPRFQKLIANAK